MKLWQWALIIVGAIILIAILANLGNHGTSASGNQAQATDTAAKPTAIPRVGSTITDSGVSVTLLSVHTLQGDEFDQPKAGNTFIVVTVKIVNNSGSEQDYSSTDFHVRSSSGNITDEEAIPPSTYTANNQLDGFGHLTNGGSVTGDVILQAPIGDHGAKLTWQPSILGNTGDNDWLLGL